MVMLPFFHGLFPFFDAAKVDLFFESCKFLARKMHTFLHFYIIFFQITYLSSPIIIKHLPNILIEYQYIIANLVDK